MWAQIQCALGALLEKKNLEKAMEQTKDKFDFEVSLFVRAPSWSWIQSSFGCVVLAFLNLLTW
jgi:hypothetical protein